MTALKRLAAVVAGQAPSSDEVVDLAEGLPFIQGNAEFGRLHPTPTLECSVAAKVALPGDILISVRAPVGAINVANQKLGIGRGLAAIRSSSSCDDRFLRYVLTSEIGLLRSWATGTTYEAVTSDDLGMLPVPDLPIETQRRIANFLDDQVARIDNIIAERGRQIELVESIPWTSFEADVMRTACAMAPLRRFIGFIADGPFGSAFTSADYAAAGPAVIRLGNIGFAEFRRSDLARIPSDIFQRFPRCHVVPGDVLIASLGDARNHAGRACVAPKDLGRAMVKGKCFRAQVEGTRAEARFIACLLSSDLGAASLERLGRGATRMMLNIELLMSAVLPVPPLAEQVRIADDFQERDADTRAAATFYRRSVELLEQLKRSLITAAVTGEFDVSTADGSRTLPR